VFYIQGNADYTDEKGNLIASWVEALAVTGTVSEKNSLYRQE